MLEFGLLLRDKIEKTGKYRVVDDAEPTTPSWRSASA